MRLVRPGSSHVESLTAASTTIRQSVLLSSPDQTPAKNMEMIFFLQIKTTTNTASNLDMAGLHMSLENVLTLSSQNTLFITAMNYLWASVMLNEDVHSITI